MFVSTGHIVVAGIYTHIFCYLFALSKYAGSCFLVWWVTPTFILEGSESLEALPILGCCSFPLTYFKQFCWDIIYMTLIYSCYMHNSMTFSKFTELLNHQHNSVLEHSIIPKKSLMSLWKQSLFQPLESGSN